MLFDVVNIYGLMLLKYSEVKDMIGKNTIMLGVVVLIAALVALWIYDNYMAGTTA